MLLCEKKRFVSSANIMGSNILDALHKSFTYIMKRSSPKIDPWGTPQIMSRLDVFIALPVEIVFYLKDSSKTI